MIVASHRARFVGGRAAHAKNVLGTIVASCSVSTRQIGATPNGVPVRGDELAQLGCFQQRDVRGSLSRTKKDVAALRLSIVSSSSWLRLFNSRISRFSSVVTPGRVP